MIFLKHNLRLRLVLVCILIIRRFVFVFMILVKLGNGGKDGQAAEYGHLIVILDLYVKVISCEREDQT